MDIQNFKTANNRKHLILKQFQKIVCSELSPENFFRKESRYFFLNLISTCHYCHYYLTISFITLVYIIL